MSDSRCHSAILPAAQKWPDRAAETHRRAFESLPLDGEAVPGRATNSINNNIVTAAEELLQYPAIYELGKKAAALVGVDPDRGGFLRETARVGLSLPAAPVGFLLGHGQSIWRDGKSTSDALGLGDKPVAAQAIPRVLAGTVRRVEIGKDVADASSHFLFYNLGVLSPPVLALPIGGLEAVGRAIACEIAPEPESELAQMVDQIIADHPELADEIERQVNTEAPLLDISGAPHRTAVPSHPRPLDIFEGVRSPGQILSNAQVTGRNKPSGLSITWRTMTRSHHDRHSLPQRNLARHRTMA